MINQEIATIFHNMSSYYEMDAGQKAFFRARAYHKAAETLDKFPHDVSSLEWRSVNKLKKINGIGQTTAEQIIEYINTKKIADYERKKKESPVKLEELLKIQGIGPKKILRLYNELGVTDIESMEKAAKHNKISELDGFGKKSQGNILESIEFAIINKDRISIATAEEEIELLLTYLKKDFNLIKAEAVGSYRRRKETVGDIDVLAISKNPVETMEHFVKYPSIEKVLGQGDTKASIWLSSKIQADIRIVPEKSYGAAIQYFTGSKEHNIKVRNLAISKGYKLSEYGLFYRKTPDKVIESSNEQEIYNKLGLQYIPPELREDTKEVETAKENKLPNLVTLKDIKGDLQTHTTHSDGKNSIAEMAKKAKELGYKYIGITDHFGKLKIANAIDESEFDKYLEDIRKADKKIKNIKIYASGEVEVGKDGELEFSEDKLKQLDYIVASVHFSTKMDSETMTERIITALRNPLVTILAHPTGRIIGQRPGFEFDYKEVFKVAKEENVALEINAHPMRLDLNDKLTKHAKDIGCKIVINTDAHGISDLEYMRYGVDVARRGWIEKKDLYQP